MPDLMIFLNVSLTMLELLLAVAVSGSSSGTSPLPAPPSPNNWQQASTLCTSQDITSIYMAGGFTSTSNYNDTVLRYDIKSRAYESMPNLPVNFTTKAYIQLWQVGNKLYACRSKTWSVLDLTTKTWSTIPTPKNIGDCPEYSGRTFLYHGRLLIFGNVANELKYKSVLSEYIPETNTIILLAVLPSSLITAYPRATLLDDSLYVAENNVLYEYNLATNKWSSNKTYPGQFSVSNMVNYDKSLYLMGTGSKYTGVTTYNTLTDTYGTAPDLNTKSPDLNIITVADDLAYILSNGTFSQYKLGV